ncbi:MAG: sigma-70 family RNA polymerase sigma factor [bacterium]|nr:sigma-70 family RNA polymerase sigma factor [bacterium]
MSTIALSLDSDAQILEAYRSGATEQAATAFVRRNQRFVYSVAMRQLNHTEDARDASQEVFMRALKGLDGFKGDSTLQTWLYRITINVCNNMRRKKKIVSWFTIGEGPEERDVASQHDLSPAETSVQTDFERFFATVLAKLPEKQRETFALRYYDELSYEEISTLVGTSVGALKANYHWAIKKIAVHLRESEYYESWREATNEH